MRKQRAFRAAVIGAGGIGHYHVREFRALENVEVVALAEVNRARAEAVAREFAIPAIYEDYRQMLEKEKPDVVAVGLPNALHCEAALAALGAGAHTLCEKPPAMTAAEARRMAEAARRAGRFLAYHFNYRYTPEGQFLRAWADEGNFGPIYFGRTGWRRMFGVPNLGTWFTRRDMAGGGPLIDLAVHRLDLALWIMGYPRALTVSGAAFDRLARQLAAKTGKEMSVEDLACGMIRLEGGAALLVEASWIGFSEEPETMFTELLGERGGAVFRNRGGGYQWEVKAFRDEAGRRVEITPRLALAPLPSFHRDFLDAIRAGRQPQGTPEQGIRLMEILEGLYRSAAEGREVCFTEPAPAAAPPPEKKTSTARARRGRQSGKP